METSFKTCMFGGFDREDVIAFIQKTAEENQTRLDALMAENEQLLTDKQAAEQQNRELTDRLAELEKRLDDESALRYRVRELSEKLETVRRENDALREPAAQYQSLKEHIADIEISAHRRTEEFRGKAIAELTQLIGRQRQWCAEQRGEYQRMAEDVLQELRRAERHVEECEEERRQIAARYLAEIQNDKLILPGVQEGATAVWHQFVVRSEQRDELKKYLEVSELGPYEMVV